MLDLIERARQESPLGLLYLDEQDRGGRTVVIDEHGEQWDACGRVACGICEEDGTRAGAELALEGWRHLRTGATVCTDCAGFTAEEFPLTETEQLDLFAAVVARDGEAAAAVLRAADAREVAH